MIPISVKTESGGEGGGGGDGKKTQTSWFYIMSPQM